MKNSHKIILIILALILAVAFRLPLTPHELGQDSYSIHFWADSITEQGYAKWVVSPLSVFGLDSYSYPSGEIYLLSVVSSLIGISTEWVIFFLSIIFGIIGFIGAYLLASEIKDEFYFKLAAAVFFSILPLSIKFTSWTYSTRGLFIMLVPFFMWTLIKSYEDKRYIILTFVLFVLMATIHKMFVLLLLMGFVFLLSIIIHKYFNKYSRKIGIALVIIIPFAFLFSIYSYRGLWVHRYLPSFLDFGNRIITEIAALGYTVGARLGFILPLSILAVILIYFFSKKIDYKVNFLVFTLLIFIPFFIKGMYVYQTIAVVYTMLAVIGLYIVVDKLKKHSKYIVPAVYIVLILFSMFTVYVRVNNDNFMKDSLAGTADFIDFNIDDDEIIAGVEQAEIINFMQNPTLRRSGPDLYIYDEVDLGYGKELRQFPKSLSELITFVKYPYHPVELLEEPEEDIIFSVQEKADASSDKIYGNDEYMLLMAN